MKGLYLLIDALVFLGPLTRSFEPRIAYYRKWKRMLLATFFTMLIMIPWDIFFAQEGYWGFNSDYLVDIYIGVLPIEEVLFFVVVPFASYFIYEVMQLFFPINSTSKLMHNASILAGAFLIFASIQQTGIYSIVVGMTLGTELILVGLWKVRWLKSFFRSYLIILIPFLLVNGILTGSFLDNPIVWYSESEILGYRIFTIPVEDAFYGMEMMLIYTAVMQWKWIPKFFS
jgi:lycopene cyclase domain-containing protein